MRLRIQTFPPLPDFKAWFSFEAHQVPHSIRELKKFLCSDIVVLKGACVSAREIQLLLDDFELLNESSFTAALRDGDLLCVKASLPQRSKFQDKGTQSAFQHLVHCYFFKVPLFFFFMNAELLHRRKRKRMYEWEKVNKKHKVSGKQKIVVPEPLASSPSVSSSSESSSSSSSSESSSTASSSSSDSSDSSDSYSSAPSLQPSKPLEISHELGVPQIADSVSPKKKVKSTPEGPFVPPGYGKATTHARNLRRKRVRALQAEQRAESILQKTPAPHVLSTMNTIPLGERSSSRTLGHTEHGGDKGATTLIVDEETRVEEAEEVQGVMMASLGNKNKKKGFKKFLSAPVPKKIVFTEDGQAITTLISASTAQSSVSQLRMSNNESSTPLENCQSRPRLIPPSEIQECGKLPPNMFVTSVDVEADLWISGEIDVSHDLDYSHIDENGCQTLEDATMPPGDEGHDSPVGEVNGDAKNTIRGMSANTAFDWSQAEQLFENGLKVSQVDGLRTGQVVGWKVCCLFFLAIL